MEKIKIKYHDDKLERVKKISVGDWVDLRAAQDVGLLQGESTIIPLGVSMKLPDDYEAIIAPRSSTFKKYKIIQTNGIGVIDNSYSGNNDIWGMPVYATEDTFIPKNERICQFRIQKRMPEFEIEEVEELESPDRGGFGSTGSL